MTARGDRHYRVWLTAVFLFGMVAIEDAAAETGRASWYARTSRTASGERCDPGSLTAAHRKLPFGTRVKVENLQNGRWVIVRINDRGPSSRGRVIDVTRAAADALGFRRSGVARVRLTVVTGP
jgi:rare lipoprotein A